MGIDPGTLMLVAGGAQLLGGAVGAAGAKQAAAAQAAAANYSAQVAQNNATIAGYNANLATQSGEEQATVAGMKSRATVGAIKAEQAASNVDIGTGSAIDVRSSASELGQLDQLTVRSNAAREAYGYQTQAQSFAAQSGLESAQAKFAKQAGDISAISSLLGGASSAARTYGIYKLLA